ncbi:MAG: superoxide dismutase [Sphingomonadales bacterium 32-68-7]|nr:MAG: superoxide dismutase [Sphingomonadales bacterium 12-68-11]OYX08808.1 MAG: superoxide dismutase [Sphingomonadales bacterium 32-68-7]
MTRSPILASLSLLALAGCQTMDEIPSERLAQATLRLASGLPAGTAQLFSNGSEVTLSVAAVGLTPGVHGAHLHTTGKCDAPEFTTAGGHLNPTGRQHGQDNPAGAHLGDLPNLTIGESGAGTVSVKLNGTREAALAALFDADGTAIVIHAGPDDYRTDPAGNSGARIVCGVLTRT